MKRAPLIAAGVVAMAIAPSAAHAAASSTWLATLTNGTQRVFVADVPADTPPDKVPLPADLTRDQIAKLETIVLTATPTPTATAGLTPTPTLSPTATPTPLQIPTGPTGPWVQHVKPQKTQKHGAAETEPKSGKKKKKSKKAAKKHKQAAATAPAAPVAATGPGTLPAAADIPNFFIDRFRIPPFLLPIYQAAGIQYGVRWEVLAAINEIETDYGRNLNVSSAGAVGWMQFMPSTWKTWGLDANHDGVKDPYNPVDAIFSSARYLRAAGADTDLRRAIFAYNHAGWYVDSVMLRARVLGGLPANFIGSLTGLTQGRFPVAAKAHYADAHGTPAHTDIRTAPGARAVAVQDGVITEVAKHAVTLRDDFGNTYQYLRLGSVSRLYPAAKQIDPTRHRITHELELPRKDAPPTQPASAAPTTTPASTPAPVKALASAGAAAPAKERLFANPFRPNAAAAGGGDQILADRSIPAVFGVHTKRSDVTLRSLRKGARVMAGTVLGRAGEQGVRFTIQPAGAKSPKIDPKPILDGWRLLQATSVYDTLASSAPSIGQVLLMSKQDLQTFVLADPRIQIYPCGRRDIRLGQIDRRVLATLEFLSLSGFKPTVSALECGHSYLTTSGNVSEHSSGNAVDIAAINGIPILGHQGPGSITDTVVRRLTTLQGLMKPHQIISLETVPGTDNTLSLPDHYDHIHVGFRPLTGPSAAPSRQTALKPRQWTRLVDQIARIREPTVRPSKTPAPGDD